MLNMESIANANMFTEPYQWGLVTPTFDTQSDQNALTQGFPEEGFNYRRFLNGSYMRRPFIPFGEKQCFLESGCPLPAGYQTLAREILSDEYRKAVSSGTGIDLTGAVIEASLWRYDQGTRFGAHPDASVKLLTHVIYLNAQWAHHWGGNLTINASENPDDIAFQVTPRLGLSLFIIRSDNSWHRVTPVSAMAPDSRNTLSVVFHKPGANQNNREKY